MAEAPASTASNVVTGSDPNFVQPSYLKQQEAPASNVTATAAPPSAATYQHPQQQQLPQQVPQQQFPQQQQQSFGMDQLTSAYSSYLPNQPHTGISGFGMNPMSNLPDYGNYGTEAQRAAAAMVCIWFIQLEKALIIICRATMILLHSAIILQRPLQALIKHVTSTLLLERQPVQLPLKVKPCLSKCIQQIFLTTNTTTCPTNTVPINNLLMVNPL